MPITVLYACLYTCQGRRSPESSTVHQFGTTYSAAYSRFGLPIHRNLYRHITQNGTVHTHTRLTLAAPWLVSSTLRSLVLLLFNPSISNSETLTS